MVLSSAIAKGITWALEQGGASTDTEFDEILERGILSGAHLGLALCERHLRNGFVRVKPRDQPPREDDHNPYAELFGSVEHAGAAAPPTAERRGPALHTDDVLKIVSVDFDAAALSSSHTWSRVRALSASPKWGSVEAAAIDAVIRGLDYVVDATAEPDVSLGEAGTAPPWRIPRRLAFHFAKVGKLSLVDRHEIDALSDIERLVAKYRDDDGWTRPLSMAVFGPPGSGKSFTVKQVLSSLLGDDEHTSLEFNLSQFQTLKELANAFHQVQDAILSSKKPPLVFFDEFDTTFGTEPLGWLKYFLAPMQDGEYREENDTFRMGRAIFVFAGGIYHTFDDFYTRQRGTSEFKDAKGPDFVSRLRGHLNIAGINSDDAVSDILLMRRAILLRHFLQSICGIIIDPKTQIASIDRGVVRAFLLTRQYEHGARSMEAIVQMAAISRSRRRFQRSSVPAASQLGMHVNAGEFLNILAETEAQDTMD